MQVVDWLLIIGVVILGIVAVVYVWRSLGDRGGNQYRLYCPPCEATPVLTAPTTPATSTVPTSNPNCPPATTPSSTTPAPATPPAAATVTASEPLPPAAIPALVPVAPQAPQQIIPTLPGPGAAAYPLPVTAGQVLVFRNRVTGRFLSVCYGCLTPPATTGSAPSRYASTYSVMAQDASPARSTSQWQLQPAATGFTFHSRFANLPSNVASGVTTVQNSDMLVLGGVTTSSVNDGVLVNASVNGGVPAAPFDVVPYDATGYLIVRVGEGIMVMRPCCPAGTCVCPGFQSGAAESVRLVAEAVPGDESIVWEPFVYDQGQLRAVR